MTAEPTLQLRTPTAVIRLAVIGGDGREHDPPGSLTDRLVGRPGIFKLDSCLLLVVPSPADEAVFDAAAKWARDLVQEWNGEGSSTREQGLSAIVLPGVALVHGSAAELIEDPLLDDFRRQPPAFGAGVFVTGRAAAVLESPLALEAMVPYKSPSGKDVTIHRLGGAGKARAPWRNPEVFGGKTRFIERPVLQDALAGLLEGSPTPVTGPLGCGKTRLVWECLQRRHLEFLWLRVLPQRAMTRTIAEQVIRQLLLHEEPIRGSGPFPDLASSFEPTDEALALVDKGATRDDAEEATLNRHALTILDELVSARSSPLVVVVDDVHRATGADVELLASLSTRDGARGIRVVLIGRRGTPWPCEPQGSALLEVPALSFDEMTAFTRMITEGLSIPAETRERFAAAVRRCPFAFEEGLFALIHERQLRQIYGSFFFGGDTATEFEPSHRFVRHIEAEVARLGPGLSTRLLALVDVPVPAAELGATASALGERIEPGWEQPLVDALILARIETPWGPGVEISSPVLATALAHGLGEISTESLRRRLGAVLAQAARSGEAHWSAYRLLSGSQEALAPLLQVFKSHYVSQIPREELLDALAGEIRLVRAEPGKEEIELYLLWRLLPLARRLNRLADYREDLKRGIELARDEPKKLLALASVKAEIEEQAGEHKQAERTIKDALKVSADIEARRKALMMIQLGRVLQRQDRHAEAEELFVNLFQAFAKAGSTTLSTTSLYHLGNIALRTGRVGEASQYHKDALQIRRDSSLPKLVGSSLAALGATASAVGNYPKSLEYYREAQELLEEHGREAEYCLCLLGTAKTLSRTGDFAAATGLVRRALTLSESRGDRTGSAIARTAVARNYLDIGRSDKALEEVRKAHFQLSMGSTEIAQADAEEVLGQINRNRRNFTEARRWFESALSHYQAQLDKNSVAAAIADLIEVCIALEDGDGIKEYTTRLREILKVAPPADLREILNFRLFQGLEWLAASGHKLGDPASYLEKAYRSVLTKANHLDQDVRQRYLFQVPQIRDIVEAATRRGLDKYVKPDATL